MQILSNHSNQSTQATAIKNIFEEANVMNNSAKFQLYFPYIFFCKFSLLVALLVAMTTNQIDRFGQKICLVEEHSTNFSVKLLSKYLQ